MRMRWSLGRCGRSTRIVEAALNRVRVFHCFDCLTCLGHMLSLMLRLGDHGLFMWTKLGGRESQSSAFGRLSGLGQASFGGAPVMLDLCESV